MKILIEFSDVHGPSPQIIAGLHQAVIRPKQKVARLKERFKQFKMGHGRPLLSFIFGLFKQTIQQIYVKNIHPLYGAMIRTHDLRNMILLPQPLDQGSRH